MVSMSWVSWLVLSVSGTASDWLSTIPAKLSTIIIPVPTLAKANTNVISRLSYPGQVAVSHGVDVALANGWSSMTDNQPPSLATFTNPASPSTLIGIIVSPHPNCSRRYQNPFLYQSVWKLALQSQTRAEREEATRSLTSRWGQINQTVRAPFMHPDLNTTDYA